MISAQWVSTKLPHDREIRPLIITCTYNRDEYLFPNLEKLKTIPSLDVIIVDNGSRITQEKIQSYGEHLTLFHNPNTGGSGGFTRGLMESLKSNKNYSHAILMDDDIQLEADSNHTAELYDKLSPREQQILRMIAEGSGFREIGSNLNISAKTVNVHRPNVMRKINVESQIDLVKYALKIGIIEID